jgi:hypothetical protein
MKLDEFTKTEILDERIGIAVDQKTLEEWHQVKQELRKLKKQPDLSSKAREKIREVIEEAKSAIAEYKSKNLILP